MSATDVSQLSVAVAAKGTEAVHTFWSALAPHAEALLNALPPAPQVGLRDGAGSVWEFPVGYARDARNGRFLVVAGDCEVGSAD